MSPSTVCLALGRDASGEPLILIGLPTWLHTARIILPNVNRRPMGEVDLDFVVAAQAATGSH